MMNNNTTEQAMHVIDSMKAVNLDEVTVEIIEVKVRYYKNENVLDEEGNPLLGDDGKALQYRRPALRMAHIQNIVPVDVYHEALAMSGKNIDEREALGTMANIVLQIWQITEPWMTKKMLIEGIDFDGIAGLFARFFDKMSQNSINKV